MLVAFLAARQKIGFVPIQTIYKTGASKIHPLTDTWRWLRWRLAQDRKNPLGRTVAQKHPAVIENGIAANA